MMGRKTKVFTHTYSGRKPLVFLAAAHQGVNYFADTWHHPLMALGEVSDFLVVDRDNTANNLEEFFFDTAYRIEEIGRASCRERV